MLVHFGLLYKMFLHFWAIICYRLSEPLVWSEYWLTHFFKWQTEKKKGRKKRFPLLFAPKKQHPASLESFNIVKTGRPKSNIKPLIHLAGPILYPSQLFFHITLYNTSIHGNLGARRFQILQCMSTANLFHDYGKYCEKGSPGS